MKRRDKRHRFAGERVHRHRYELGMTLKEFSERVGVSEVSISLWERGQWPNSRNLKRLAEFMQVPVGVFLDRPDGKAGARQ